MTPLAALIARRIAATGPITLAEYMAECLLHPEHGYYTTRPPFGMLGDFTTAPEISQMFGEMLGLCLAQAWLDQGSPPNFTLAELGPGRGTLMADAMRATRRVPGFHAAANLVLLEASPALRTRQRAALDGHVVTWIDQIADLPDAPLFLLANEFFDALPIRQFTRMGVGWSETVIGLRDGALALGRTDPAPLAHLGHRLDDTQTGGVVEVCPASAPIMAHIGGLVAGRGGAALIVDYGGWDSNGNTFQAVRNHCFADPMAAPGEADLTAHVDFAALARTAIPATYAYTTQAALLLALGMGQRAAALATQLEGEALESHFAAYHRLTDPVEMGSVFKVLALYPAGAAPPPGCA
jgi:NADH dehydrogenase [ubiquinone] 1 alpha subcomplex assembly factor 7